MPVIYIVRHGQASFLKKDYDQLSDLGFTQAKALGKSFQERSICPDHIFTGSMVRHQQTASGFQEALEIDTPKSVLQEWNEYDHMELLARFRPDLVGFEGITEYLKSQKDPAHALQKLLNDSIHNWIQDKYEYTISWKDFKRNIDSALKQVVNQVSSGEKAIVFSSGGPIAVLLMKFLRLPDDQFTELLPKLVNTGVTRITTSGKGLSLISFNEHSHLDHNPDYITYR